jgi:acyl-coenzyme A thioesterase PaaI-like protein
VARGSPQCTYIGPVPLNCTLTAQADIVQMGSRVLFFEASLFDDKGKVAVRATQTAIPSSMPRKRTEQPQAPAASAAARL